MKAIRIHGYGGPEVLQYEDVVVPTPVAGELLIKVQAASVNPLDWKTRAGYLKGLFPSYAAFHSWLGCFRGGRSSGLGCHEVQEGR
jgi:NADPH:quinone reductase-like Zn-dependent oxidoreductase